MQADHFGHRTGSPVAKVTIHGVTNHRAQFFEGVALRHDGMTQRRGDKTAIHLVFLNFENDFAHR